jgi:hypothetical protein
MSALWHSADLKTCHCHVAYWTGQRTDSRRMPPRRILSHALAATLECEREVLHDLCYVHFLKPVKGINDLIRRSCL